MKKYYLLILSLLLFSCSADSSNEELDYSSLSSNSNSNSNSGNCYYNGHKLYVGEQGGCYYYNSSGNKTYVDRSYCVGCN